MFVEIWETFREVTWGYGRYLVHEISNPRLNNYFYWLIGISLFVFALELWKPWRKNQAVFRRDFWLDAFYMFFNFFLFSLLGFAALSTITAQGFQKMLGAMGLDSLVVLDVQAWPTWVQLVVLFVLRDIVHYFIHRLLHRVPILWEFHKVHHSVLEMGFAAHMRYHWMENVVYRTLEYIPLAMIGFGVQEFIVVHLIALLIGHLNHANIKFPLGPLKYLFNNPQMHIWHHVAALPSSHRFGINFGISLSLWDYLFGTAHIPSDGRDIALGFDHVDGFPQSLPSQLIYPLGSSQSKN